MAAISGGNVGRRRLADISNLVVEDGKPRSTLSKDNEQILKEIMQLMKILAERNKIIEVTGIELQKLMINQQKMQEHNKQLAQSNSHLLADLNSRTEKLRELQHELGCKNGLLKALQRERESQVEVNISEEKVTLSAIEDRMEVATKGHNADKQDTFKRRVHSKSLGSSHQLQPKEKSGNKRACVRRQSARFNHEEADTTEDPETKFPVCPPPSDSVLEDGIESTIATVKDEVEEGIAAISHEQGRPSISRPSRMASKKVESCEEIPLTGKSLCVGPSCQLQSKEKAGNKSACVRRQSARFKSEEAKLTEDLSEITETKFAVCPPPSDSVLEDGVASTVATVKDEDKEGNTATSHEHGRPSIGRPSRLAAKKVQSYKEIPLTAKMRRSD